MRATSVRFLAGLYSLFFLALAVRVIHEAVVTQGWSNVSTTGSVLVGLAALSGWSANAMTLLNFLFGFGGGLFIDEAEEQGWARHTRIALYWLVVLLVLATLAALWMVAEHYAEIESGVSGLKAADLKPSDALATIGALNLGIAGGFLIGLAIPGRPGAEK